jgi:predicted ThiF/HesA family dinucleotide-utilizing enzyme
MTVIELMNALEIARGDYDDPVLIVRPVVGIGEQTFRIVDVEYSAAPATSSDNSDDGAGHIRIVISRED